MNKGTSMTAGEGIRDIVLRNAQVVDGTGNPWFYADVGIRGERIVFVRKRTSEHRTYEAAIEIDCKGLVVCPGFIDIHNHSDLAIFSNPNAYNYIFQGVTTIVVGNCGTSAAPLAKNEDGGEFHDFVSHKEIAQTDGKSFTQYLMALKNLQKAINVAALVGHGQIRNCVLGLEKRPASNDEIINMKACAAEAMEAGAFGLSTGLIYSPGMYATTQEIVELAKVVSKYDGLYVSHLRSEADTILHALMECVEIAEASGCRAQVSHLKASGRRNWGMVDVALRTMEYARRTGVEITFDAYPFAPSGASIFVLFPDWARSGGKASLQEKIQDPNTREQIKKELERPSTEWENIYLDAGPEELLITSSIKYPEYVGKTLADISTLRSEKPLNLLFTLAEEDINMSMIAGGMSEDDNNTVLAHRLGMIASDSRAVKFGEAMPHPRTYCAFTKVLSRSVKEQSLLPLEVAIYKMTGFPAWKLGLHDRGVIKSGAKADLVVLDLWKTSCESQFADPHHYAEGVEHLMVNGQFVIREQQPTNAMPGQVLSRTNR